MAVMNEQYRLNRGAVALMMVLVAIVVGVVTYNLELALKCAAPHAKRWRGFGRG